MPTAAPKVYHEKKAYKSAKAILRHALADIQDGLWCTGMLSRPTTDDYGTGNAVLREKPLGCALGLVSMYGGIGEVESFRCWVSETSKFDYFDVWQPTYPDPDNASPAVQKAIDALFNTIPKNTRTALWERFEGTEDSTFEDKCSCVWHYNDEHGLTRSKAAKWFAKALDSVS